MGTELDLQRALWRRLWRRAARLGSGGRPDLAAAERRYLEAFDRPPEPVSEGAVQAEARRSGLVLLGDHHALDRAQAEARRWLEVLVPDWIAVEWLTSAQQAALDRWARGGEGAAALFERCGLDRAWGAFCRSGSCALLERARALGVELVALDHPRRDALGLAARDAHMAARLERTGRGLAFVGAVHLVPEALPARLSARRPLVLLQEHAPTWFALQDRGCRFPAWARLGPKTFVHLHTHPLLVEEATLHALAGRDLDDELRPEEDLARLLQDFAETLGLPPVEAPDLLSACDPRARGSLKVFLSDPNAAGPLLDRLELSGHAFLSAGGPLVVTRPGLHTLAEAAGRWYHLVLDPRPFRPADARTRFAVELEREFVAFSASLFVDPSRPPIDLAGTAAGYLRPGAVRALERRAVHLLAAILDADGARDPDADLPDPDSREGLLLTRWAGQELARQRFDGFPSDPARAVLLGP